MRAPFSLSFALILALLVPVVAQENTDVPSMTTPAAASLPISTESGTFVSHRAGSKDLPETVTLQFDWQGTPVMATYLVRSEDHWTLNDRPIDWGRVTAGTLVPVPASAKMTQISFGGPVGVGVVTNVNMLQNSVMLRSPDGTLHTLRISPQAMVLRDNQLVSLSRLVNGDSVLFEIPPSQNQVAVFTIVAQPRTATVVSADENTVTLAFREGGKDITRTYDRRGGDLQFISAGQQVAAMDMPQTFQRGQTVWLYGSTSKPNYIVSNVNTGFETALYTPEAPTIATAPMATMAAPFNQGEFVSYTEATANMPALVTLRINWQGSPMLATFPVRDTDRWVSASGQTIDFTQLAQGTTVYVPSTATVANMTLGGQVGVATITGIDRTNNIVAVRLPSGETRRLRYSAQGLLLQNGMPVSLSELTPGQTVLFEVAPNTNAVALFTPIETGVQGTVTAVSDGNITVRWMQNGVPMTSTFSTDQGTRFFNAGSMVAASNFPTTYRIGQPVWIYGPTEQPDFVASGLTAGYEVALAPAPMPTAVAVQPTPRPVVRGIRQAPRVIRGRW